MLSDFTVEDVLGTERDATTGTVLAQLGDVTAKQATSQGAEVWGPCGFASRPAAPTAGQAAAQAFVMRAGAGRDVCLAMRDIRKQAVYGALAEGDTAVFATSGAARALLKANGSIVLYTTADNTESGAALSLTMSPSAESVALVTPWGTIEFSRANGFRVRHVTAGDIALAPVSMPAPFSAIGNTFTVTAGICRLESSTVVLGAGNAVAHCAYGVIPGALTTTAMGSACVFVATGV